MASLSAGPAATSRFVPDVLHGGGRCWPETNCYTDLWIELLASRGWNPAAAFGFGIAQAHEGDQFTFSKIPFEDLRRLFGLTVQELSIYRSLEQHAELHVGRGCTVLIEVDAFHLPDTAATSYRRQHVKTTIAVDHIDPPNGMARYFHNAAYGLLEGHDYRGAFRLLPEFDQQPDLLPPYVEIVKYGSTSSEPVWLHETAVKLLRGHLSRRPPVGPFTVWRDAFASDVESLIAQPDAFHDYAFHFPRSIGANFELLGSHAAWLSPSRLADVAQACDAIAQAAKILQFRLARSIARRRPDPCTDCFDTFETAYGDIVAGLESYIP